LQADSQICCDSQSEACILKSTLYIGCHNKLATNIEPVLRAKQVYYSAARDKYQHQIEFVGEVKRTTARHTERIAIQSES